MVATARKCSTWKSVSSATISPSSRLGSSALSRFSRNGFSGTIRLPTESPTRPGTERLCGAGRAHRERSFLFGLAKSDRCRRLELICRDRGLASVRCHLQAKMRPLEQRAPALWEQVKAAEGRLHRAQAADQAHARAEQDRAAHAPAGQPPPPRPRTCRRRTVLRRRCRLRIRRGRSAWTGRRSCATSHRTHSQERGTNRVAHHRDGLQHQTDGRTPGGNVLQPLRQRLQIVGVLAEEVTTLPHQIPRARRLLEPHALGLVDLPGALLRRSDHLRQPVTVTGPDGTVSHREYDESGNLVRTVDAAGAATSYEYDRQRHQMACAARGLPAVVHCVQSLRRVGIGRCHPVLARRAA